METKIITVTPSFASGILSKNNENRPVYQRAVSSYSDAMKKGQWALNGEPIIISKTGRLLDGQHRLHAVIKADVPVQMLFIYGVDDSTFATLDQGKKRTIADTFAILDIPNSKNMAAIISSYFTRLKGRTTNRSFEMGFTTQDSLNEYKSRPMVWDEILKVASWCYSKKRILKLSTVGAYMAYLIIQNHHKKDVVYDFFRQLFSNENVCNGTITLLRERLIDAKLGSYNLSSRYQEAIVIKTWNAYITERVIKTLKWSEAEDMPKFI